MKKTIKFFKWFKKLGGQLDYFDVDYIFKACTYTILQVSTFKNRSEEIKEKYNHRFNDSNR